jgi:hypothetical protein
MDIPRPKLVLTYRDQVIDNIYEWYMSRGQNVPREDLEACRDIDREVMETHLLNPEMNSKPAYGTPEFWKMHWQKKKAAAAAATPAPPKAKPKATPKVKATANTAVTALTQDLSQIHISTTGVNPGSVQQINKAGPGFKFKPKVKAT